MEAKGYVTKIEGDICNVVIYRSSACGETCGKACATCKGASKLEVQAVSVDETPVSGDRVVIESDSSKVMRLAAIAYLVPLAAGFAAFFAASLAGLGEDMCALSALAGLVVGFIPAFVTNKKISKSTYVIKKIENR